MNRISERRLAQLQAVSGLVFATFLLLHLVNTMVATLGQAAYDGYLQAVRHYYQASGVELLLIGLAPLVHVAAGLTRAYRRRKKAKAKPSERRPPPLRVRLHRWSGLVLLLAFFGHVGATRGTALLFDQPADFSFVHYSLTRYPWFFYPYYVVFAASGLYHLVHGVVAALPLLRVKVARAWLAPRSRRLFAIALGGSLILLVGLLALGGLFFEIDTSRFAEIDALWARVAP